MGRTSEHLQLLTGDNLPPEIKTKYDQLDDWNPIYSGKVKYSSTKIGEIKYSLSQKNKKYETHYFEINLKQFQYMCSPLTDKQDFYLKNNKINNTLKEINESLNTLIENKN